MDITVEQFTAAMEAAVAEKGADYVYPKADLDNSDSITTYVADDYHTNHGTCMYSTPDGTPACIIGVALSKIDPEIVPAYGYTNGANSLLKPLTNSYGVREAARDAQEVQDHGGTWGEALEAYKKALEKYSE